jgi:pyrroloquinoline quinone (PQQ) biosynthesis protein C
VDALKQLQDSFEEVKTEFHQSAPMQRLQQGRIGLEHYKSYLRQTYFYTRENPQIQALATVFFRGSDRSMVGTFLRHASSEFGHDALALADLARLGEDVSQITRQNPLPNTSAFNAFPYYQIYNRNPHGYLGYLYFLEFTPTSSGEGYMNRLRSLGVPDEAMGFLAEHTRVDIHHNKLMEKYLSSLIQDQADLSSACYAMRVTGKLFADMLQAAFDDADKPRNWGMDLDEHGRMAVSM